MTANYARKVCAWIAVLFGASCDLFLDEREPSSFECFEAWGGCPDGAFCDLRTNRCDLTKPECVRCGENRAPCGAGYTCAEISIECTYELPFGGTQVCVPDDFRQAACVFCRVRWSDRCQPPTNWSTGCESCPAGCRCYEGTCSCFSDVGNGVVRDLTTGLEWQQNRYPFDVDPTQDLDAFCRDTSIAGYSDWRVPTVAELQTLATGCASTRYCTGGARTMNGMRLECRPECVADPLFADSCRCGPVHPESRPYRYSEPRCSYFWSSSRGQARHAVNFNNGRAYDGWGAGFGGASGLRCVRSP